jgi:hypothetical protein
MTDTSQATPTAGNYVCKHRDDIGAGWCKQCVESLERALRAAERDAARYRGFRSALINSDAEEPALWIQDAIGSSVTESEFDAAIDAALAGAQEEGR